jgi:hypothetical protein
MREIMSSLIPNTLQYPNFYVDQLMWLLTPEENTVLMFAARQILGWDDTRESRLASIAVSVFCDGYKVHGQQVTYGTGLSRQTVVDALESLCHYGILERFSMGGSRGAEYKINIDATWIKMAELRERRVEKDKANKERTRHLREKKGAYSMDDKHSVPQNASVQSSRNIETKKPRNKYTAEKASAGNIQPALIPAVSLKLTSTPISGGSQTYEEQIEEMDKPKRPPKGWTVKVAHALAEVCNMEFEPNRSRLLKEAKLLGSGAAPEVIHQKYGKGGWWYRFDWRGKQGQFPYPSTIRETWAQWNKDDSKGEVKVTSDGGMYL